MLVWLFYQRKRDVKATKVGLYMSYVADFQSQENNHDLGTSFLCIDIQICDTFIT